MNFIKNIKRVWKRVLLYGFPRTGKTLLTKALTIKGKNTFFNIHSSSFTSKWRIENKKSVRLIFLIMIKNFILQIQFL